MSDGSTLASMMVVTPARRSTIAESSYAELGHVILRDADRVLADQAFVAIREGDDLVIVYADGTQLVIEDYFENDVVFTLDSATGPVDISVASEPIGVVDGQVLQTYGGRVEDARAILRANASIADLEPLLIDEAGAAAVFQGSGAALGAVGLGVLGALGGSSGGGGAVAAVAGAIGTVVSGKFVAGPVIPGNGLLVDLYNADTGALLRANVPLAADGSFSVTLPGTVPNVIGILRDTNIDPDYRDEATAQNIDLTANLSGIGQGTPQPGGTTFVSLNINPVTTVAARLAGVGADGTIPPGGVTAQATAQAIQQVQNAFGIGDINGVAPTDIFDPSFNDADGNVTAGEQYGQVLAMLSGKDKINGGDQAATINQLLTAINGAADATAAQSAIRQQLLQGAVEFEFNNTAGTEIEADLLSSSSLGIQRTPSVDQNGQTTQSTFSALLADALTTGTNPNAQTVTGAQTIVDTSNAIQRLAALDAGAPIPQDLIDALTEANLTALGLTGVTAPSPYLAEFRNAVRDAAPGGADSLAELQALFNAAIVASLTPTIVTTPNSNGTLSISGQSVPGARVTVTFPDGTTGTAIAGADGRYGPVLSATPQTSGQVRASAVDGQGTTSPVRDAPYTDTTAPVAPTQSVTVNTNGTLSVSGTGEPGSTVTVTFPNGTTGTATVAPNGTYGPVTSAAPQTSGNVTTTQRDAANNTSPAATTAYTDTIAPLPPSQAVTTNPDGTISVSGTGEPGATVTVTFPNGTTGTAVVAANGSYGPVTSVAPQPSGNVTTTQRDAANNVSAPTSATYTDITPPLQPTQTVTANPNGTLSVSGTGEPGATVTVTFPNGTTGTAVVAPNGSYGPVTSAAPQTSGNVTTTQRDAANNLSPAATTAYTDATAPLAPAITQPITVNSNGTLSISGTGEPGSTAIVTFPDGTTGTALVAPNGTYGPVTSAAPQTSGNVSVAQRDAANNTSPASVVNYVDTTVPVASTQTIVANPNGTLSVSGEGEPGATVTVTFPDGTTGTAVVATNGTYGPITSAAPQTSGAVLTTQRDLAGNTSPPTNTTYTDNTAPLAPTQTVTPNSNGTLAVSGTGEPGSTVTVTFPDGTTGSSLVRADGTYGPVTSAAPQTSGTVRATQTDAANNTSPASTRAFTDTTPPVAPVINEPVTVNSNGTLSVSGTGEPGATTTVTFPDGTTGTGVVRPNGTFGPITSTAPQTSGNVTATQRDLAGNVSTTDTAAYTDTTAPLSPTQTITANSNGTLNVSGTGEPGSTVTVTFPDGTSGTGVVRADGTYGPVTSPTPQTSGTVSTTQRDAAGNISPVTNATYADTTAPLPPTQTVSANPNGTLSVSGTGEAGSTVTVTFPDGTTGTGLVRADGTYGPVTSATAQTTGNVRTTQTDAANNGPSAPTDSTYTDMTAPLAPTQTAVTANPNGTLSVSGRGEAGSTVTVTFPDGTTGTGLVRPDGTYGPVTSTAPQTSGNVGVTQTDAAGNGPSPAITTSYTDTTAPAAPVASSTMDSTTGAITTTGTAEPFTTVTVTFPDGTTGTTTAAADGTFSVTSGPNQPSGNVTTRVTDRAGNGPSAADTDAIVENVPPASPVINAAITDQANTVSGTGEAGATVTVTNGGVTVGTATVWTDGTWSLVATTPIADGAVLTATQTDRAGNVSAPSAGVTTFTDTDRDGTANSADSDADGSGISNANFTPPNALGDLNTPEAGGITENAVMTTGWTGATAPTTGADTTVSRVVATTQDEALSLITVSGEGITQNGTYFRTREATASGVNIGSIQTMTFDEPVVDVKLFFDSVGQGAQFGDFEITYANGTTVTNVDFNVLADNFGVTRVGGSTQFSALDLAKRTDGAGIRYVEDGTFNGPTLDSGAPGETGLSQNKNQSAGAVSFVGLDADQLITAISWKVLGLSAGGSADNTFITPVVTYRTYDVADTDGDGINNAVDIDNDGDRIWDKYELGAVGFLRTDTDQNGTSDTVEATLTGAEVSALVSAGAGATYTNGAYSTQFILLSEAVTLDFTQIANSAFSNVEYIDMRDGNNAQTVRLDSAEVIALTSPQNELVIVGDNNDTVNAIGFVDTGKHQSIEGRQFSIYEHGGATLFIDDQIGNISLT